MDKITEEEKKEEKGENKEVEGGKKLFFRAPKEENKEGEGEEDVKNVWWPMMRIPICTVFIVVILFFAIVFGFDVIAFGFDVIAFGFDWVVCQLGLITGGNCVPPIPQEQTEVTAM
ncbi:MAG: hypothetical protein ACTSUE_16635 [Promethearchaeota archaeon]